MHTFEGESWERWLHYIRRIEFERTVERIPLDRHATVLELGSGDGFQLGLLRQRFDHVFAIDPEHRPACADGFVFAVAETLPFPDGAFDLVVSNCVVEHLRDRPHAIREALRVLRVGGYMAHVVPRRFWKITSLALNPVGYPLRVAEKWWARRQALAQAGEARGNSSALPPQPEVLQVLGRWFCPPVHGTYPSHLAECRAYGRQRWTDLFTHSALARLAEAPLFCYTQFGFLRFRLLGLRDWLSRRGLVSSAAFILRKIS